MPESWPFWHGSPAGRFHEEIEVQREAGRFDPQAGQRGCSGEGPVRARQDQLRPPNTGEIDAWRSTNLRRVRKLETQNARLQRLYAGLALDSAAMQDLVGKGGPAQTRDAAWFLVDVRARRRRRTCKMVDLSRLAWSAPPLDWTLRDTALIAALAGIVEDNLTRGFSTRRYLRRCPGCGLMTPTTTSGNWRQQGRRSPN